MNLKRELLTFAYNIDQKEYYFTLLRNATLREEKNIT